MHAAQKGPSSWHDTQDDLGAITNSLRKYLYFGRSHAARIMVR